MNFIALLASSADKLSKLLHGFHKFFDFCDLSDGRLENMKSKIFFQYYLELLIIWHGLWIQEPYFDGKNIPKSLRKCINYH